MKICYSALFCFYDYLTDEGYAFGNPIPAIRKQSPYLIKGTTKKDVKRLSDLQWEYLLDCAQCAADADPGHHASMGTTDKVYIQSDMKERAHSGKKREV